MISILQLSDEEATKSSYTSFDSKLLAFRALQRGLKFGDENWRMWVNYMIVAMDVGELSEATRALGRIVELRADKDKEGSADIEVLETLVDACGRTGGQDEAGTSTEPCFTKPNEGAALTRRVFDLIERQILPRISSSPRVFRAYARLLMFQSRYGEALQAHMNAYRLTRAGGGGSENSGNIHTAEEWHEAVEDVEEIVDVLRNLGPKARPEEQKSLGPADGTTESIADKDIPTNSMALKNFNWPLQTRSILRSFLGRTRRDFGDEPEFSRLEELLEEIRNEAEE